MRFGALALTGLTFFKLMTGLLGSRVNLGEGEATARAARERLLDPEHGEGFEKPTVGERPGVDRLEAEVANETEHNRFASGVVACDKHRGRRAKVFAPPRISHPAWFSVLNTNASGASAASFSPPDVVWPIASCRRPLIMASGLVQSITVLPLRPPAEATASGSAAQGVATATTSAEDTASTIVASSPPSGP